MKFPTEFFRVTKGSKPRYQLYQPGFNPTNSCWLNGSWITLSKEEWEKKKNTHQKLYAKVLDQSKNQNHRDKGTALKNMTPAQRQAWVYFSGENHFDCMRDDHYSPISVNMAGNQISDASLAWMRKEGYKIIERTKAYNRNTDQLKGYKGIPEDVIFRTDKYIDTVRMTIDQNKGHSTGMFEACLKGVKGVPDDFAAMLAFHHLTELEESMIRSEWEKTRKHYKPDPYDDYEKDKEEYVKSRAEAKKIFGDKFSEHYEASRESHNSCARINVKNGLFTWVLPVFHDDGTHEPWKTEDVPDTNIKAWGE